MSETENPVVIEEVAPVVETVAPEPVLHTDTPTLIDAPVEEAAPVVEAPADPVVEEVVAEPVVEAPVEVPPEPVAPEPVTYTDFDIPETLKIEPEQLAAFTELTGKYGVPQEAAQALINQHTEAMSAYAAQVAAGQHEAFAKVRASWRDEVLADPNLGGAGHQTAMRAVARMRDMFVSKEDMPAFNMFLRVTGAGDHPQFLKLLHRAARLYDEPALPPPNAQPVPQTGKTAPRSMRDIYKAGG